MSVATPERNPNLLLLLGVAGFASALTIRIADPMVPLLARDLGVDVHAAALLLTAYTLPYALGQPFLGPLGDARGKGRVIVLCLFLAATSAFACAFATNYWTLFALRSLTGVAAGGVIPLALAAIGDNTPLSGRQVALSRFLAITIMGQLLGPPMAGLVSVEAGWRTVFLVIAVVIAAVALITRFALRIDRAPVTPINLAAVRGSYRTVLRNPKAAICYGGVLLEGLVIFGFFPYVAVLLEQKGAGGTQQAGFVIAGTAIGGILFSASASWMLPRLGRTRTMTLGGLVAALGFLGVSLAPTWPVEMACFVVIGFGFYMLHTALQAEATELAPGARGAAVALHAFFFFTGQASGPIVYGLLLPLTPPERLSWFSAPAVLAIAVVCATLFRRVDRHAARLA